MPVGPFPDFESCVVDQMRNGSSRAAARRICGAMEKQSKLRDKEDDMKRRRMMQQQEDNQ